MNDDVVGALGLGDVRLYRRVTIAVVATYLGLEDDFVEAALADRIEDYLQEQAASRERLKAERYHDYLAMLAQEAIVCYAGTAAQRLAQSPEHPREARPGLGESGPFGQIDDFQAMVRVHEIFELLESPDGGEEADRVLQRVKRQMCQYYLACAHDLVQETLLLAIIAAAEEWLRQGRLSVSRTRELVIAGQ